MNNSDVAEVERSLAKGLIAGLIGGLAGALAKSLAERMFPPRIDGEAEPQEMLAEAIAAERIQWGFGAAVGAAYGALAEFYPAATAKDGASFGTALEALTHEAPQPAPRLSSEPEEQSTREHASEMTSHVVYGIATEVVRGMVRKLL